MRTIYDPDTDALYLRMTDGKVLESEEVSPGVILDFDSEGRVIAVEVSNASKTLAAGSVPVAAE